MEVHRALGHLCVGEDVVQADHAVRPASELARSRAENLQPRGVRSSVELFGHFRTSESGQWRRWAGNRGFRKLINSSILSPAAHKRQKQRADAPVLQRKLVNGPP